MQRVLYGGGRWSLDGKVNECSEDAEATHMGTDINSDSDLGDSDEDWDSDDDCEGSGDDEILDSGGGDGCEGSDDGGLDSGRSTTSERGVDDGVPDSCGARSTSGSSKKHFFFTRRSAALMAATVKGKKPSSEEIRDIAPEFCLHSWTSPLMPVDVRNLQGEWTKLSKKFVVSQDGKAGGSGPEEQGLLLRKDGKRVAPKEDWKEIVMEHHRITTSTGRVVCGATKTTRFRISQKFVVDPRNHGLPQDMVEGTIKECQFCGGGGAHEKWKRDRDAKCMEDDKEEPALQCRKKPAAHLTYTNEYEVQLDRVDEELDSLRVKHQVHLVRLNRWKCTMDGTDKVVGTDVGTVFQAERVLWGCHRQGQSGRHVKRVVEDAGDAGVDMEANVGQDKNEERGTREEGVDLPCDEGVSSGAAKVEHFFNN